MNSNADINSSEPEQKESCLQTLLTFDRLWFLNQILQYVSASILIIASIIRFALVMQIETFAGIALTLYLLLIAAIFIGTETSLQARQQFYFLNFGWGKSLAYLQVVGLMLGSGAAVRWLDILCSIYFVGMAVCWMPVVSVVHWREERALVDSKVENLRMAYVEKAKKVQAETSDQI